jgi:hypothetical protein
MMWMKNEVDFTPVQNGEISPHVFVEQIVASSPENISNVVRVMCAVLLGAFVMQGCAGGQMQVQGAEGEKDGVSVISDDGNNGLNELEEIQNSKDNVDPDSVLRAIKRGNSDVLKGHTKLCSDQKFMLQALEIDTGVKKYLSQILIHQEYDFIMKAIEIVGKNASASEFDEFVEMVGGGFKDNKRYLLNSIYRDKHEDIVVAVAKINHESVRHFGNIKNYKYVIKGMIEDGINPGILDYSELNSDGQFILELLNMNLKVLEHTSEHLLNSEEFMTYAVEINEKAIFYVGKILFKNKEFMQKFPKIWKDEGNLLAAIEKGHSHAASYIHPDLKRNLNFMLELTSKNPELYSFAHRSIKLDEKLLYPYLKHMGFKEDELEPIKQDLEKLDIYYPDRFSKDLLLEVMKNRKEFGKRRIEKNVALFIYNQSDWNSGYTRNDMEDYSAHGYHLLYFEASGKRGVSKVMNKYRAKTKATKFSPATRIEVMEVGGHGKRTAMRMGDEGKNSRIEARDKKRWRKYRKLFNPNAVIISRGCETGEGRDKVSNVANMFHASIPRATINSPAKTSYSANIYFDELNRVEAVDFRVGTEEEGLYRIDPNPKAVKRALRDIKREGIRIEKAKKMEELRLDRVVERKRLKKERAEKRKKLLEERAKKMEERKLAKLAKAEELKKKRAEKMEKLRLEKLAKAEELRQERAEKRERIRLAKLAKTEERKRKAEERRLRVEKSKSLKVSKSMKSFEIQNTERFSDEVLNRLTKNHKMRILPDKPIAALFYNSESEDFENLDEKIQELEARGFHVMYYDVDEGVDIRREIRKIRKRGRKVDYLVIGGESNENGIQLSKHSLIKPDSTKFFTRIRRSLSDDAEMVIDVRESEGNESSIDSLIEEFKTAIGLEDVSISESN